MKILYKNKKVEQLCSNESKAIKELGAEVSKKLSMAIYNLEKAENLKDILCLAQYNLHQLKGNLKGVFSMYLGKTTGYRLLLYPLDEEENIIISNATDFYTIAVCIEIIEVSKHYE